MTLVKKTTAFNRNQSLNTVEFRIFLKTKGNELEQ